MRSLLGCAPLPRSSCRATCLTAIPSTASCSCPACDWRWVRVNGAINDNEQLCRDLSPVAREAGGILGGGGGGDRVGEARGPRARGHAAAVLPLVCQGATQHLLERARPACRRGTRRAA